VTIKNIVGVLYHLSYTLLMKPFVLGRHFLLVGFFKLSLTAHSSFPLIIFKATGILLIDLEEHILSFFKALGKV
jgi:hypothetical protein